MGRKHVHQTAQFGKLEIIASCMIFQIDPIRQFCTKHVPMTQYAIMISTSTTPSCGGPLRAQIFQNFYNQKCEFWPLLPFLKRPPELVKNENFQKKQFLLFYFVTLKLLTKNYVSITKTAAFSPYGPLRAP